MVIVSTNANNVINLPCPPYYCDVTALPANIMHDLVIADSVHKRYCLCAKISRFHVHPDNVRSLYVVQNNVEHLCNSNLLLYYVNPNMYK